MKPDSFRRMSELFEAARRLEPEARAAFLAEACGDDAALRDEVENLLARHSSSGLLGETDVEQRGADLRFAAAAELGADAPERLGPYRILEVLGEGGMGIVYYAEQTSPVRRRVAVKAIKLGMDTKEVLARFEAERQALALMNHPSIAQVYDAGHSGDGRPYFVMEYVAGTPLNTYCDRNRLGVRERIELIIQVCHGVQHAHHRGILHRDLKPSNVLVAAPDDRPVAKIIDFGVAKATNQQLTERTLYTEFGRAVGTPAYMSPEMTELSAEQVDHRADVYSMGVILYELLVGQLPHDWETLQKVSYDEMLRHVRDEEPATPSTRWTQFDRRQTEELAAARQADSTQITKQLRGDLDWITMRALEKDRRRRYQTAAEMAADLTRFLHGEPVEARPPSAAYRVRKFVRRHRALVVGTAAVFIALLAGLIVSLVFFVRAHRSAEEARQRTAQVLQLSDIQRLADYRREMADLWPAHARMVGAMEKWLANSRALSSRLADHRQQVDELRRLAASEGDRWQFDSTENQWWHDNLATLVDDLSQFADPVHGAITEVERRLEFARTIEQRSISDYRAEWSEARKSIAAEGSPYARLDLAPQLGLVPLGQDPVTGFWEFGHLQTGAVPRRGDQGELLLTPETGLVFVLIPGGRFRMGAVAAAEPKPETNSTTANGADNIDPDAEMKEGPVHEVELAPFFMSKYEMTQAQWLRVAGGNPSVYDLEKTIGSKKHSPLHPVENVSWNECETIFHRLELQLPTEAQWEYAARAGTSTVWWTGDDPASLAGAANLADAYARDHNGPRSWIYEAWSDGYLAHAPANKSKPNPFGLHGMLGNVKEWCRDQHGDYAQPVAPRTGERQAESDTRILRGGSYDMNARRARVAFRGRGRPELRSPNLGVRPVRVMFVPGDSIETEASANDMEN